MRKILIQSGAAFIVGILLFLAGDRLGLIPDLLIPAGVIFAVAGAIGFILGLIIREPDEVRPGGGT
jgi:uncharacterized membrane protein